MAEPDDDEACRPCHAAIVDQWAVSQHATAWSDPVFQAGYAVDREPECRACHAPLAKGDRDPAPGSIAAKVGIACRVCHATAGVIVGPAGGGVHGGPAQPGWGTSEVCRSCHQFNFAPDTPSRRAVFDPGEWMQRTYAEWEASGSACTCQDCHMPWETDALGQRHRSHRMLGIADVDAMARAVAVMVQAELRDGSVVVTTEIAVDGQQLAHAFPTGDMFRTARLEVWPVDEPGEVQAVLMRREFGRVARPDADGRTRLWMAEVGDSRPRPGHPTRRTLRWGHAFSEVKWRLTHLRMDTARASRQGVDDSTNARVVAQGQVTVSTPRG
ncbi:MAG: hypothetical protein K0V04_39510 [Deltaproteobacteria bacterium]|nr:hypothetical protein [Deltaproteobacteria bacterium]